MAEWEKHRNLITGYRMYLQKGSGNLEHGNDHINILETYSGIEWIREIEERISRHYGYSKVTILNLSH